MADKNSSGTSQTKIIGSSGLTIAHIISYDEDTHSIEISMEKSTPSFGTKGVNMRLLARLPTSSHSGT